MLHPDHQLRLHHATATELRAATEAHCLARRLRCGRRRGAWSGWLPRFRALIDRRTSLARMCDCMPCRC